MKILFASSEVFPLIKTGGLADVSHHLPKSIQALDHDIRIIMPAYYDVLGRTGPMREVLSLSINSIECTLLETTLPNTDLKIWLVKQPELFSQPGNPYEDNNSAPWGNQAQRFAYFSNVVSLLAQGKTRLQWQPDIVHCNDWHTGLVPVYLKGQTNAPGVLFTVHNLAYQGLFNYSTFCDLGLDQKLWHFEALEFHNQLSFIKGGLVFSNYINTVSPTYAKEVTTPEYGGGLDGLFRAKSNSFSGILNGIDWQEWNPETDKSLCNNYSISSLDNKVYNKLALQQSFKLHQSEETLLIGWVARFTEQKGIDLVIDILSELVKRKVQLVFLGSGDKAVEKTLLQWTQKFPKQIALSTAYDETLAHQIIAGSDFLLMPSRFEPCGLTQLYSLRYGTIPIARNVGGLSDTIKKVNALTTKTTKTTKSNGILFNKLNQKSLLNAIDQAIKIYSQKPLKEQLQRNGMQQDFSWQQSAKKYIDIYQTIIPRSTKRQL